MFFSAAFMISIVIPFASPVGETNINGGAEPIATLTLPSFLMEAARGSSPCATEGRVYPVAASSMASQVNFVAAMRMYVSGNLGGIVGRIVGSAARAVPIPFSSASIPGRNGSLLESRAWTFGIFATSSPWPKH